MEKAMDIGKLDKNMADKGITSEDVCDYNCESAPFKIYGVTKENGIFARIPLSVAEQVSEKVVQLTRYSSGGRIRFITDSDVLGVKVHIGVCRKMNHCAFTGTIGCDFYASEDGGESIYVGTVRPPVDIKDYYEGEIKLKTEKLRQITINMPTYSEVKEFYVVLKKGCTVLPPKDYKYEKPVVYYGSSITHGACASRGGNIYQAILSRELDTNFLNIGLSGNCRAETVLAEYISGLDMSAFVYDYDHNAPNNEYYAATHEPFFKIIREKNPDLPVLFLTRPKKHLSKSEEKRIEIARTTYENALKAGDKNVWFIEGRDLILPEFAEVALVDNAHPNDAGFLSMAQVIKPVLKEILEKG